MSIFKEKDEYITKLFNEFNESDDEEDEEDLTDPGVIDAKEEEEELDEKRPLKKLKSDTHSKSGNSEHEEVAIISLSDGSSDADYLMVLDSNKNDEQAKKLDPEIICDTFKSSIKEPETSTRPVRCTRSRTRAQEVITLSSSDEDLSNPTQAINTCAIQIDLETPPDLDDYDFNLKLTLAGCYKQFKTTYKTKLNVALDSLISEIKAQGKNLTLCLDNETVSLEETPYSLSLTSATILKAIEIQSMPSCSGTGNPNIICIKLQDGNRKHTREFKINKHEPMLQLKELYAKEFDIDPVSRVKLLFDGDVVDDDDLPVDLEIEDDCVLDVMVN